MKLSTTFYTNLITFLKCRKIKWRQLNWDLASTKKCKSKYLCLIVKFMFTSMLSIFFLKFFTSLLRSLVNFIASFKTICSSQLQDSFSAQSCVYCLYINAKPKMTKPCIFQLPSCSLVLQASSPWTIASNSSLLAENY